MSECFNPNCLNKNLLEHKFCQVCGSKLLLGERYRAIKYIGEGGFGRTFKALDEQRLNTTCVIKQFLPSQQGGEAYQKSMQLFKQEANCLKDLGKHPQIPELLAFLEQDNRLYLVQEFIEGDNLLQELEKKGNFSEKKIEQLLRELLDILQFIHQGKVIHRDIKPENILRRKSDNKLFLIDFGIARNISQKTVAKGTTIGSFGYVPWEQMNEGKVYPASDLYSLGATCFHLLTGKNPWDLYQIKGYSWTENWQDYLTISLKPNLREILNKLLQINYQNRYSSAKEVLKALDNPVNRPTTINQTAKTVLQTPIIKPNIKLNTKEVKLKADKKGQFLVGNINISNYTKEGAISGEWHIKPNPKDPPYTDNNHPWISFRQNRFFSHQPESINSIIKIDTSKLQCDRIYKRRLLLLINPGEKKYSLTVIVKTAPISLNVSQFPYKSWLGFTLLLIAILYCLFHGQDYLNSLQLFWQKNIDFAQVKDIFSSKNKEILTKIIVGLIIAIANIIDGLQLGINYWKKKLSGNNQIFLMFCQNSFTHIFWLVFFELIVCLGLLFYFKTNLDNSINYLLQIIGLGILNFIIFNLLGLFLGLVIYLYRKLIATEYKTQWAIVFLLFTTSFSAIMAMSLYLKDFIYLLLPLCINSSLLLGFFIYKIIINYNNIKKYRETEKHLIKS